MMAAFAVPALPGLAGKLPTAGKLTALSCFGYLLFYKMGFDVFDLLMHASIGGKAMAASYAALATTGHNIANANVAGYSRQQVELATAQSQYTGAGFFGKGVDVSTVSRAHDALLTREAASTRALAAMDTARLQMLQRLEAAFPTGEQGIGYAAGQFLNAMTDLAAHPADASTRQDRRDVPGHEPEQRSGDHHG